MPSNIAHMVIAHKALAYLKENGFARLVEFAEILDGVGRRTNFRAYMNLGSVGPDLYYYESLKDSALDMLKEGFVQAKGVTPWAYHLHSHRPNEYPLKLIEILFRDVVRKGGKVVLDDDDRRKLAYIAGHLSHIAADQIVHPVVNAIAGPYYRSGDNRKKHRECEVFQDYFLYEEVYRAKREQFTRKSQKKRYDFFEQRFNKWADCVSGLTTRNTEDWFRYFLQRGFAETYGALPDDEIIEDSVDNLLLILKACTRLGPYEKAAKEYERDGENGKMYQEYIKKPEYVKYYEQAVQLTAVYVTALYEVYVVLMAGDDFDEPQKKRFLNIVDNADLSCPLEHNILEKAYAALARKKKALAAKYKKVFTIV
jgi:hypothetical protein